MDNKESSSFFRWFIVICVSGTVGAVANVVVFFLLAFLFAGSAGDKWVRWYFGGEGHYFFAATFVFAMIAFPFVKKLRHRLI